jgi:hypothetical protein
MNCSKASLFASGSPSDSNFLIFEANNFDKKRLAPIFDHASATAIKRNTHVNRLGDTYAAAWNEFSIPGHVYISPWMIIQLYVLHDTSGTAER